LIYILLIALLFNVSKRSAIFWAVIYNAMMAISELIMFFTARYIVGIENAGRKDTVDIIFMFCLCNISYFLITQTMVFIKKKSIAFDKNDMSKILLMGSLTTSLIVFMTYYIIGTTCLYLASYICDIPIHNINASTICANALLPNITNSISTYSCPARYRSIFCLNAFFFSLDKSMGSLAPLSSICLSVNLTTLSIFTIQDLLARKNLSLSRTFSQ
jgi:hypothetical protein